MEMLLISLWLFIAGGVAMACHVAPSPVDDQDDLIGGFECILIGLLWPVAAVALAFMTAKTIYTHQAGKKR